MKRKTEQMFARWPPRLYRDDVPRLAMPELLAALLAAGGPSRLDARDHRRLHEALIALWIDHELGSADRACLPISNPVPDPEVQLRVSGVTRAIWQLHSWGVLVAEESQGRAEYLVDHSALQACTPPEKILSPNTWSD
ncbi:hypothetical protein U2F26_34660 [Micromonospora sp. 4G57]|uniref:hypothetical protein n=1 Tax=Micromonospora sicca TaxID=2202420 RepID=UPI002ACAC4CF|nr:hypothetical protein [Micromonospora sp. 4G53]MDZ5447787.1 hypothetical protein [Micromonospora sp. 4G57]